MAVTSSMNWGINLLISLTFLTVTGKNCLFSSDDLCPRKTKVREAHPCKRNLLWKISNIEVKNDNEPFVPITYPKLFLVLSIYEPACSSSYQI